MKTPALAMLLAGATAKDKRLPHALEMARDRAFKADLTPPNALDAEKKDGTCTDDAVTQAGKDRDAAVGAKVDLVAAAKKAEEGYAEKQKAKLAAIKAVLDKEKEAAVGTDTAADYKEAMAALKAKLAWSAKEDAVAAAEAALAAFG